MLASKKSNSDQVFLIFNSSKVLHTCQSQKNEKEVKQEITVELREEIFDERRNFPSAQDTVKDDGDFINLRRQ